MSGSGPDGAADAPRWFRDALAAPYEDHFVEVAGCRIHYVRWGDPGSPGVILVHGGAAHAHWWTPIAPQLARDCQVIAVDLSGHGDSGRHERRRRAQPLVTGSLSGHETGRRQDREQPAGGHDRDPAGNNGVARAEPRVDERSGEHHQQSVGR